MSTEQNSPQLPRYLSREDVASHRQTASKNSLKQFDWEKPRHSKKELQWVIKYLLIWYDTQFSIQEQYPVLSF